MQIQESCRKIGSLTESQVARTSKTKWLDHSKVPVLVGGHIGFLVAYCIGLYTIYYVARSYKRLELKVRPTSKQFEQFRVAGSLTWAG